MACCTLAAYERKQRTWTYLVNEKWRQINPQWICASCSRKIAVRKTLIVIHLGTTLESGQSNTPPSNLEWSYSSSSRSCGSVKNPQCSKNGVGQTLGSSFCPLLSLFPAVLYTLLTFDVYLQDSSKKVYWIVMGVFTCLDRTGFHWSVL